MIEFIAYLLSLCTLFSSIGGGGDRGREGREGKFVPCSILFRTRYFFNHTPKDEIPFQTVFGEKINWFDII